MAMDKIHNIKKYNELCETMLYCVGASTTHNRVRSKANTYTLSSRWTSYDLVVYFFSPSADILEGL